jgi:hypothetical protein
MRPIRLAWALAMGIGLAPALGDEFDRLEGRSLADLPGSDAAEPHESLTVGAMMALPGVLMDSRATLLVVETDQGNLARMLVSLAFRKPSGGDGAGAKPAPILMVERFDTFEAGPATTRLARGRDLALFDGFRLDLDTGQVVPDGHGGDVRFVGAEKPPENAVEATGGATIYTVRRSPIRDEPAPGRPSPGRNVLPGDFAGRYRFVANDQWTGRLDLDVDAQGVITGELRSEESGNAYKVTGQVDASEPNLAHFAVEFPRSRLECAGRLFTEGKDALAGTASLLERVYGFYARREPGDAGGDAGPVEVGAATVIEMDAEGVPRIGGEALDGEALDARLRTLAEEDAEAPVVILADGRAEFRRVRALLGVLERAGLKGRIAVRGESGGPRP